MGTVLPVLVISKWVKIQQCSYVSLISLNVNLLPMDKKTTKKILVLYFKTDAKQDLISQ